MTNCDRNLPLPRLGCVVPSSYMQALAHPIGVACESDPHGKPANQPGAKLDAGKNRLGLVLGDFALALEQVGEVGTKGAEKYTAHGWISVENGVDRYTDAMMRHWIEEQKGEALDPQTSLLHAAHLAWNSLARLDLMLRAKA